MEKITSRQNKTVREAAALLSSAEERAARGEFLCEGARLCQDAARSGIEVLRCFVTAQALEKYAAYLQPVLERARQSYLVADHVAGLLSSTKSPQGVFCQCRWPQGLLAGDAAGGGSCAVLEDLQDPGNLGTILRTAEALGIGRVVLLGDCCDPPLPQSAAGLYGGGVPPGAFPGALPPGAVLPAAGGGLPAAGLCAGQRRFAGDRGGLLPGAH